MKCLLYSCLIFIAIFLGSDVKSQDCQVNNDAFLFHERVDYTIYYHLAGMWVGAGDVYFKVDSTQIAETDYYHINSYGRTYKKYDWLYKVRDSYESYVNTKTFKPIRFKREVNEGSTHLKEDYIFRHKDKEVISLRKMGEDSLLVKDTVPLLDCSYDVITMIYFARNMDFSGLEVGETMPINIFLDNKSHETYVRYLGKKELKIKGTGTFRCILFSPYLIEGTIFNGGEDMTVWVTDDKNKVPLYIETPILVGSIRARINNMEGLKYPLDSKIAD